MSQVVALLDMNLNRDKERKHTVVAAAAGPVRQDQMAAFLDFWKIILNRVSRVRNFPSSFYPPKFAATEYSAGLEQGR